MEPVVQSVRRQKQFITDAGHELKTPITVIATSLRLLEMEVGQQKWLEKAQNQTERLKELVNSLVTLSRMDEEESPLKLSDFAVSEAVEETAESFRDFARSQGRTVNGLNGSLDGLSCFQVCHCAPLPNRFSGSREILPVLFLRLQIPQRFYDGLAGIRCFPLGGQPVHQLGRPGSNT